MPSWAAWGPASFKCMYLGKTKSSLSLQSKIVDYYNKSDKGVSLHVLQGLSSEGHLVWIEQLYDLSSYVQYPNL